jgi:Zn-dependent metalloprotease
VSGYLDNGTGGSNNYFLFSEDKLFGVYNYANGDAETKVPGIGADWMQQTTDSWGTTDSAAISLANNLEDIQNYVSTVLGRNSFNNAGAFAQANVHVGTNYINAFWHPSYQQFFFGDGGSTTEHSFAPLTVLDVTAHEFGHALTEHTSNLVYQYESGALNEAYSDILGAAVEFFMQPDGTSSYPEAVAGQADWLIGEDAILSRTALRDLRNPQRYNLPSYYKGTNWYIGPVDKEHDYGGVHTNNGVACFAYYLLAEGGAGTNDGHAYNITGIGREAAAAVALRANYYYHTANSNYLDARKHWLQAAKDLGYNEETVADVWTACGVLESTPSALPAVYQLLL